MDASKSFYGESLFDRNLRSYGLHSKCRKCLTLKEAECDNPQYAAKAVQLCLSKEMIDDVKTEVELNCLIDAYFINILKELLALKAGDRVIRYPKNWKEAIKERWFPQWMKKRLPVKYREYDALVVFPDLLKEFPVPMQLRNKNYYMTFTELGSILPGEINEN